VAESSPRPERLVVVCQYRSCLRYGSAEVLAKLMADAPSGVTVQPSGCLGLCGSGPIVLVMPDDLYYWRVNGAVTEAIITQHLIHNQPVLTMLHPRLHGQ